MSNNKNDAEKLVNDLEKDMQLSKAEEKIKDNKLPFEHKGKSYRIRLLNLKEKEELDFLRRKKFGELYKNKDILREKDIIKLAKERGDNSIDEIDEKIKKLKSEENDLMLRLGESLAKKESKTILDNYYNQINELERKMNILKTERGFLTELSLENCLLDYIARLVTFYSLEILENDQWKRAFDSLEELQTYEDETLINKAGAYSMIMQYIL